MKCSEMKRRIYESVREYNDHDTVDRMIKSTLRSLRVRNVNGKKLLYKTVRDKNSQFNNLDVWCVDPIEKTVYVHSDILKYGPYDRTVGEAFVECLEILMSGYEKKRINEFISISNYHLSELIKSKENFREEDF